MGWNGIESWYNGLSKTTIFLDIWSKINKIRVFENDEHFEKKKGPQPFGPGSSGWSGLQSTYYALSKTSKNIGIWWKIKKL